MGLALAVAVAVVVQFQGSQILVDARLRRRVCVRSPTSGSCRYAMQQQGTGIMACLFHHVHSQSFHARLTPLDHACAYLPLYSRLSIVHAKWVQCGGGGGSGGDVAVALDVALRAVWDGAQEGSAVPRITPLRPISAHTHILL